MATGLLSRCRRTWPKDALPNGSNSRPGRSGKRWKTVEEKGAAAAGENRVSAGQLRPQPLPGPIACRLVIQGRVNGRLTFYSPKIVDRNVLQLGTRPRGERIRETLVMKVSDERRRLTAERIETEPAFLHARLTPYAGGSRDVGLYRLEVEIPGDAPARAHIRVNIAAWFGCGPITRGCGRSSCRSISFWPPAAVAPGTLPPASR